MRQSVRKQTLDSTDVNLSISFHFLIAVVFVMFSRNLSFYVVILILSYYGHRTSIQLSKRMGLFLNQNNSICSIEFNFCRTLFFVTITRNVYNMQGVSCEGACAHARVRCAVARVRVRAKRLLKYVCDVRACGHF